ncbi:TonB-dependent receptor [Mucilaginibacter calamicampi]|uniref:TonB-dependent receptor n=1 Tax=Mucilaginibacter calamicampi TaxID=1302352 RepID=A0ABW2YWG4_9SPHI
MKGLSLLFILFLFSLRLLAQVPGVAPKTGQSASQVPAALEFRDVSGIVKDEKDEPVPGAVVFLQSPLDSVYTTTNANGVFIFKQVKRAGFYITVSGQGIAKTTKLYRNNDLSKQIVLDPFELKPPKAIELKEVTINGAPTIVYKQDTVEYKASDYKVREGDTLDELLKKMEGFDVGRDGTLLYNGEEVKKARLNGKDFLGGSVSQVIQNLPAEIIEKAQVIDDYGEQAAKTGIKTQEPTKLLNVTTKPDRSIGTYMSPTVSAGNDKRYSGNITITHINANRQISITGRISNTQNGVSSGTSGGGGAGTTFSGNPSISYSDDWKKLKMTSSYNLTFSDNNSINKSFGETYSAGKTPDVKNTSYFTQESTNSVSNRGHRGQVRLNYDFDKYNNIQVEPTFSRSTGNTSSNSYSDNINNFITGFEHRTVEASTSTITGNTTIGVNAIYQHIFKKPRRNFSIQLTANKADNTNNGKRFNHYRFFEDETLNKPIDKKDSLVNLLTRRTNNTTTYGTTFTYLEPLSQTSQLEFIARFNRSVNDNVAKSDTVLANGQVKELTRLSNIFNYAFNESRLTANYTYNSKKINLSVGASLLPTTLSGTRVNNNNNQTVSAAISNLRLIPVLRFTYIWSTSQRLTVGYTGNNNLPSFDQIQPFTDISDQFNIITGNPNLKPAFTNSVNASYNNYIANSKFNISLSLSASETKNKIVTNTIQRTRFIEPGRPSTANETTFINIDGAHSVGGNYTLSKQLADRRYNLSVSGNVNYGYNLAMSNGVLYHTSTWNVRNSFGPRINPNDVIEINPSIQHQIQRNFTSLPGARSTLYQTTSLAIDGRFTFNSGWRFNYSASKNFVTGLGALNTNPLVINAGAERQLFKKNNVYLSFNVYDILKQNNFIQQNVSTNGVTNTLSNALSRYFMVSLRANFQKWGGRPKRGGEELKRKGDGSFIY